MESRARYIISAVSTKDKQMFDKHGEIKRKYNLTNEDIVRAGVKFYEENSVEDLTQNNIS